MGRKKRRVLPQSGDRIADCIFRMIIVALESISVRKTKEIYDVEGLAYVKDESCFKELYKNEFATIYQVVC